MNSYSNRSTDNEQDARKKEERKQERKDAFALVLFIFIFVIILGFIVFLIIYYSNTTNGSDYCRKEELKSEMKTKISNGADLEVIEDVFADRYKYSTDVRIGNNKLKKEYYDNNITLLQVLKDLRSDYFDTIAYTVPPTTRDTAYYSRLNMIISEYKLATPFDGLERGQQELFVNLQTGLGDDYEAVKEKIASIAHELNSKNALVEKYLNKSNDSYNLSIIALIVTIIFGILGLLVGVRARKEKQASK